MTASNLSVFNWKITAFFLLILHGRGHITAGWYRAVQLQLFMKPGTSKVVVQFLATG